MVLEKGKPLKLEPSEEAKEELKERKGVSAQEKLGDGDIDEEELDEYETSGAVPSKKDRCKDELNAKEGGTYRGKIDTEDSFIDAESILEIEEM